MKRQHRDKVENRTNKFVSQKNDIKEQSQAVRWMTYFAVAVIPLLLFYIEAFFTYNPFERTRGKAQVLNLVFMELVFVLLFVVIGSAAAALRIETACILVIGVANYYVVSFRGAPIVPWDILSLGTAASVAGGYSYAMEFQQILLILLLLALFILEGRCRIRLDRRQWIADIKQKQLSVKSAISMGASLLAGAASIGMIYGMTWMVQQDSYVSEFELYPFLFTPNVMYERNGFAVTFLMDLQYMSVEKPEDYDAKEIEELLSEYEDGYSWTNQSANETDESLPNLIVIMNEAFSDVSVLGEIEASEDYMPFIHSLEQDAENAITGNLYVSVKGGNTANTEFEFLTGSTMAYLPAGSIPYQQYITGEQPSLASYLASLGYSTTALHPYKAAGWSRDTVYPYFGFEEFLDQQKFTSPTYLRGYVDDASCTNQLIEEYEQKKAQGPVFLFNVTMQNHSPYTDGYVDTDGNIIVEGIVSQALLEYLTLIKKSDEALQELVTYFEQIDDPTMIVFFGDHQPTDSVVSSIYPLSGRTVTDLSTAEEQARYEVPYVIWANYDIDEASGVDTSANYLAAQALEAAGIPLSDYQNYLLELAGEYPVISTQQVENAAGEEVSTTEEALRLYQKLQYYLLFDKKEES